MIQAFSGLIGGGKTYSAVFWILRYLANGGIVRTNIAMKLPECREFLRRRFRWELGPDQLQVLDEAQTLRFWEHTPAGTVSKPSLVVIDEAHIWLDSRGGGRGAGDLLTFLTLSRHKSIDLIFISQSMDNVDVKVRRLVEFWWRFRDMRRWTVPVLKVRWPINQIVQIQYDCDAKTEISRRFEMWDADVWKCYDTFQIVRAFAVAPAVSGLGASVAPASVGWSPVAIAAGAVVGSVSGLLMVGF